MDAGEGNSTSGVTVVGSNAPSDYHVSPRNTETPTQFPGSIPQLSLTTAPPATAAGGVVAIVKKKRGRPRKYASDGSATATKNVVMSPKPISSLVPSPPVIDFSSENKRGKFQQVSSVIKLHQPRLEPVNNLSNGERGVAGSIGANFTPHVITVNTGEDVTMKIISFSQQGPRAICILSANGVISSVTLRQPDSSGGTLTYEGRFEILSLTGSFMPSETGGLKNRSGGMSVSLASPDGRVVGGGVAGLLIAAGPIQIVVGSFLASNQHEQTPKQQKPEHVTVTTHTAGFTITSGETEQPYHSSPSFRGENWPSPLPAPPPPPPSESTRKPADINVTLAG